MAENLNNLPEKVVTTIRFYNTTGIIEKGKNIYFAPFLTNTTNRPKVVRNEWLSIFNTKAFYSTELDQTLSGWQPEDRKLVVVGTASQFRSREGFPLKVEKPMNYCIITETYYKMENEEWVTTGKYTYYAYFIDSIKQTGRGSVEITVTPDHFTNVFFLQNSAPLPARLQKTPVDVFNGVLKETHVNRQHYDRVKVTQETIAGTHQFTHFTAFEQEGSVIISGDLMNNCAFDNDSIDGVSLSRIVSFVPLPIAIISFNVVYSSSQPYLEMNIGNALTLQEVEQLIQESKLSGVVAYSEVIQYTITEDNLPVFSEIEEGFKYKRQYRDLHTPLNYGNYFTNEELHKIEIVQSWVGLTDDLKEKCIQASLAFFHFSLKQDRIALNRATRFGDPPMSNIPNTKIRNQLPTYVTPISIVPDFLNKFKTKIDSIIEGGGLLLRDPSTTPVGVIDLHNELHQLTQERISNVLLNNNNDYCPYVNYLVNGYISRESFLRKHMNIDITNEVININCSIAPDGGTPYEPDNSLAILLFMPYGSYSGFDDVLSGAIDHDIAWGSITHENNVIEIVSRKYEDNTWSRAYGSMFACFAEMCDSLTFNLSLPHEEYKVNLSQNYFDPVLTFNPYSFYSISYLGRVEVPLNRLNYYEGSIKGTITAVPTDSYKLSFVPTYMIEGKEIKYYTESLEQTLTNNVTFLTSELMTYMIANRAQMKNQYAVNDLNNKYGLVTTAISGAGNIAGGAIKGSLLGFAGIGASAGAIQTATSLINQGIDWDRSNKEIEMNQKAKLADLGNMPNNLKQVGTDITLDLAINEIGLYINHYHIDELSKNSICKYLERFGYTVNLYDRLHVNSRVGWDFIKLNSFDFNAYISEPQEEAIREIFLNGVTLLHNPDILEQEKHNYEYDLKKVYRE